MQRIVQRATEESEPSRSEVKSLRAEHSVEVSQLKEHFTVFRQTQDSIVQALEKTIKAKEEQLSFGSKSSNSSISGSPSIGVDAEERIRRLEYSLRVKTQELEAVLHTVERTNTTNGFSSSLFFSLYLSTQSYDPSSS